MTWEGIIPRKRRKSFERFLQHDNPRIRALAAEMQDQDRASRALMRAPEVEEVSVEMPQDQVYEDYGEDDWFAEIPF